MTNKPATPLPWTAKETAVWSASTHVASTKPVGCPAAAADKPDAAYIVAACNAYPELVAALRYVLTVAEEEDVGGTLHAHNPNFDSVRALLAKLGEG